jgi:hypothetical protein
MLVVAVQTGTGRNEREHGRGSLNFPAPPTTNPRRLCTACR